MLNYSEKRIENYYWHHRNSTNSKWSLLNIVERSCGEKPTSTANQSYLTDFSTTVDHIIHHHEDHPSIRYIKTNLETPQNSTSSLSPISEQEVNSLKEDTT